ncbi:hypothetical protein I4U23_023346 [Adineta vaga]|nr:hypothetical protein I4U23_023346 [Adineta vaga]
MSDKSNHTSRSSSTDDTTLMTSKQCHRCFSIIREFSMNTTAHGLPRIIRSESIHNRIYWSIASISFASFMIYFIIQAIINYLDYPTQIDLSIDPEWPQRFPAFTFCNAGTLRLDKFIGPFTNFTNSLNITNTTNSTTIFPEQAPYIGPFVYDLLNRNQSLEPFFYSLSSMLISCTYNGVSCSAADFIPFISTAYGYCYTFNAKLKNASFDSIRNGTEYGGVGKLELNLYVHSYQYVPYYKDSVGIVALIHDNTQVPLVDASSFDLVPGQKHRFNYRKKNNEFLPSPYTTCNEKVDLWMQPIYENYPNSDYGYSQNLCLKLNIQIYTYTQCGCVNPTLWDIRKIILPNSSYAFIAPLCNRSDLCPIEASQKFFSSVTNSAESGGHCPQQCSMIDFLVKKSSLASPMEWQYAGIKNFVEQSSIPYPSDWSTRWREYISANYLAVNILRETHVVENNIQKASIDPVALLSNIGGQTGLWLGISLLSIMELFEMFYRLLRYQCCIIRSKIENYIHR